MWDAETWKNIGTGALFILGFTWPLIAIVINAIVTGEKICGCSCHEGPYHQNRDCSCGDRW